METTKVVSLNLTDFDFKEMEKWQKSQNQSLKASK